MAMGNRVVLVLAGFVLWLSTLAPAAAGTGLTYYEEYVYRQQRVGGKLHTIPRERLSMEGRIVLEDQDISRLSPTTPWKIRIGDNDPAGGSLAEAAKLRLGARNGRAVFRLEGGGRLALFWDRRALSFKLDWNGAPQLIEPLPRPLKPSPPSKLPPRLIGIALGDITALFDVSLRGRTTRRGIFVRGRYQGPVSPWGAITIVSPAHGSTAQSEPVDIRLHHEGGADPAAMRVFLNGSDITAKFGPAQTDGVRQAQVTRPALNLGKNQLQVTSGRHRASSQFLLSYAAVGGRRLGGSNGNALPLLVGIKTRYMTGSGDLATDYNLALYLDPNNPDTPTLIQAPPFPIPRSPAPGSTSSGCGGRTCRWCPTSPCPMLRLRQGLGARG